jgi:4-diphosphocytidyl-2-C-methyl-D-erythritol kinase
MILFPPAKINLGLKVLSKRADGYHEIESCMLAIPLTDVLEVLPAADFGFQQSGILVDVPDEHNLCVKAFRLFQERYAIGNVWIHLRKQLPMGAGLGGGSADATYVLLALNRLFETQLTDDTLRSLAAELGSDCPFFVSKSAQIARGRGEILSKLDLNLTGWYLKIINPGIHIGTKEAYDGVHFSTELRPLEALLAEPVEGWKDVIKNDFETSIFEHHPLIASLKSELYAEGAVYASMSGSGSTVFGIFEEKPIRTTNYLEKILAL